MSHAKHEIKDEKDINEIEADISQLDEKKRITALFSIRAKLLEGAKENDILCNTIFERRKMLANLFRKYGGEHHSESARIFEDSDELANLLKDAEANTIKFRKFLPGEFDIHVRRSKTKGTDHISPYAQANGV